MYKNQYSQNRPSSVSSAQTKNYFYSNTTSRLAFQPSLHTQSPQKLFPFHKVDSTMIQREVNNPKKELLINNASIGNSRVQTQGQVLHFRYINKQQMEVNKVIQTEVGRTEWQIRFFTLYNKIENIVCKWAVINQEFDKILTENNSNQRVVELKIKYQKELKMMENALGEVKGVPNIIKKQEEEKENRSSKSKYSEQYVVNIENENINLCAQLNKAKAKLQKYEEQERQLSRNIQQYQMQIRELDNKNSQYTDNLKKKQAQYQEVQERIGDVERQFALKQQSLREKEENERILKNELMSLQSQCFQVSRQKQEIHKLYLQKQNELQVINNVKVVKEQCSEMEKYHQYYEQKIAQITDIAKEKQEKIKQHKETITKQQKKINEISDNYISQKQLETLHKKIQNYENTLLTQGGVIYNKLSNETHQYFNGKVFEEEVIYELKKDNRKLLHFIEKNVTNHYLGRKSETTINIQPQSQVQTLQQINVLIEDALFKINKIIQKSGEKEESPKKSPQKSPNKSPKKRDNKLQGQLSILKIYMVQISEYCGKVIKKGKEREKSRRSELKSKSRERQQQQKDKLNVRKEAEQQINFYKKQNSKLQERITELLNINSKLKEQLTKKSPEKKVNVEYWKLQVQSLQGRIVSLQGKLKKTLQQKNNVYQQYLSQQNKSLSLSSQLERLSKEVERTQSKTKKHNETLILEQSTKIEQLQKEKENLEKDIGVWMKRYKDYEWKFTSVLDEISKLNDRNSCLEIRLKDTETLFTKINELEIKLIELNNGMNYNAPVQIYYNYITVFTYQQLCNNIQNTLYLLQQSDYNHLVFKQIQHNSQVCLKILNSIKPIDNSNSKDKNIQYTAQIIRSHLLQLQSLFQQLQTQSHTVRPFIHQSISKCLQHCADLI